ncbi:MAG: DUF3391 domain-containing protein [Gammaproteobacteria bacterium]|nr:DUF3391 domain-containing protein [Gammaproteobacteria bacterium]
MIKTVRINELQVGMYIIIPGTWMDHPFTRSQFRIKNNKQIRMMREHGLHKLKVDLSKSNLPKDYPATEAEVQKLPDEPAQVKVEPQTKWNPENLVPTALMEAISDKKMDPATKAKAVYKNSLDMMTRLLESPKSDNIHTGKDAIKSITNMVLSDDDTAYNMLRITSHDLYTYTHSVNVGITAIMLAKDLFRHSDDHDLEELGAGFFLHDLGKVDIDPRILNKPGRLTDEEMNQIRNHPYQGYKMLKEADALSEECKYIVLQHHEVYDGTGYPNQILGEEIHDYGRICCLADVFEALTAERSYKQAIPRFDALKLMRDEMPKHFSREMLNTFIMLFK